MKNPLPFSITLKNRDRVYLIIMVFMLGAFLVYGVKSFLSPHAEKGVAAIVGAVDKQSPIIQELKKATDVIEKTANIISDQSSKIEEDIKGLTECIKEGILGKKFREETSKSIKIIDGEIRAGIFGKNFRKEVSESGQAMGQNMKNCFIGVAGLCLVVGISFVVWYVSKS